jgi:hypothetical protein
MRPTYPPEIIRPRPVLETLQMRVPQGEDRIPGSGTGTWTSTDGPYQSQRSRRLDPPSERKRCTIIPRVHRILSILHQRLFKNSTTADRSHEEKFAIHLDRETTARLRTSENTHVCQTSTSPARLPQNVHAVYRRIGVWSRSSTGTRRISRPQIRQTQDASSGILLIDVHPHRKEL